MKDFKFYRRYVLRYLLVCAVIIVGCIPFASLSYQHIRENKIRENIAKMESGVQEFENNIQKMKMIGALMADDSKLLELELVKGPILPDKQLHLKYLMDQMFDIASIYDYSSYFFIMMRDNDGFISKSQVSSDYSSYYGSFIKVADMSGEDFKTMIFDPENISQFIAMNALNFYQNNRLESYDKGLLYIEPLNVTYDYSINKAVLVFFIEPEQIAKTLLIEETQANGIIQMEDKNGQLLLSYGEEVDLINTSNGAQMIQGEEETYRMIRYSDVDSGISVELGYPMSLIDEDMHEIVRLLIFYGVIGIIIALIFVLLVSRRWFKPIGQLIHQVQEMDDKAFVQKNEFDGVRQSILKLVSDKDELETKMLISNAQKQAIFLENTFIKGFYRKEDEKVFLEQFPLASQDYRVVYLQLEPLVATITGELALQDAVTYLEKNMSKGFIHVHSLINTQILLIPYEETVREDDIHIFFSQMIKEVTAKHEVMVYAGISSLQHEISHINVAYYQARQTVRAYLYTKDNFIQFYRYVREEDTDVFNLNFLNKLSDLLLSGSRDEIHQLMDSLRSEMITHKESYEMHKAEIFHLMVFVEYGAFKQISMSKDVESSFKIRQYQQNHSLIQCLDILADMADEICDWVEKHHTDKKKDLLERMLNYLHNNFKRCEMTTELAASELGISDRYLATFLKEHTGKSFADHLNDIRIEFAKECLLTTDWVNEQIAAESGFGATNSFYRVFKKHTGMTPTNYKKLSP